MFVNDMSQSTRSDSDLKPNNPFAVDGVVENTGCSYTLSLLAGATTGLCVLIVGGGLLWQALRLHGLYTGTLDTDQPFFQQLTGRQVWTMIVGGLLILAAAWLLGRRISANIEGQFERLQSSRLRRSHLQQQVDEMQKSIRAAKATQSPAQKFGEP
ncbi:MAG: hypothetical protein Fues2KO_42250 [Fuerstiella sp.]